jgi:CDP-L-myo-inositol myo-inositolphosphotransferase
LPTPVVIQFSSGAAAAGLVAGLPAAARAVREAALAGVDDCWLAVNGAGALSPVVQQEITRLAGGMRVGEAGNLPRGPLLLIRGEALVAAAAIRAALASGATFHPALRFAGPGALAAGGQPSLEEVAITANYAAAGRAIVAATAKSTDGIVSRSLNRPLSQAISRFLLRFPGIRPMHATIGTAALGVLMFAALIMLGSPVGLVTGAVLFQVASVFDGVDGEIARATYRTTDRGAMIDTMIDATINLSFVAGIVVNLAQRGHWSSAMFGIAGLAMLVLGLTALGGRAQRAGAPLSFDSLKGHFRDNGSRWGKWVVWLTMRDFLALASVMLVIVGLTDEAIVGFAAIMAGWLVVVLTTHARLSAFGS